MKRICKQCGTEFTLSESEIAFYRSKNLHLPKRCENCRRENKMKVGGEPAQQTVRPYHGKKDNTLKKWVAAAVICLLFAAAVGTLRAGVLRLDTANGASAEVAADVTADTAAGSAVEAAPAEAMQERQPGGAAAGDDVLAGAAQEKQPEDFQKGEDATAKTAQEKQPEDFQKGEDAPAETAQEKQPENSRKDEDAPADMPQKTPEDAQTSKTAASEYAYSFRKAEYLQEHFEKHGAEFGFATAEEYLAGANRVVASPEALHKLEGEDGDDVYYLESGNEIVFVSTDGYIRTYFKPNDGKAYFDRQ